MDTDNSPTRNVSQATPMPKLMAPSQGGSVEPANRATVAKEVFQTPVEAPGNRYELRDPFAEVTYRANTLREIVSKADQIGSSRFTAVDAEGNRTTVHKVDGEWQLGTARAASPARQVDGSPVQNGVRNDAQKAANVVPIPTSLNAPTPPDTADLQSTAKIDAQAERAALVARLETALIERYVIKRAPVTVGDVTIGRTEYRFRGDTSRVAFTESTFRLATDTNSPSVARSMVDVAEARNWRALRVSGNEDFKRMVWLEASVRGVKAVGYEPNPADLEVLKKERETRLVNRIEPDRLGQGESTGAAPAASDRASVRGGGGRKAVLVAIEAVLIAKGVPEKQRAAVMDAATEKLAQRIRDGQAPRVKVYDKAAPSQRPIVVPTPEVQRTRERTAPAR
jgi:hypothetical protein